MENQEETICNCNNDNILCVDEELNDYGEDEPFDPRKISITKKNIALDVIIRRLKQRTIRLAPDFQRKVVWDKKQKSRLIESLMLNIPIPMFYVAADEQGNWDVVDGLQRLTTIKEFILGEDGTGNNKSLLSDLEFWDKYNGKSLEDLPAIIYNRILETEFTFAIVEPNTPERVKNNIFRRINTGGNPLTPQEIRNALYNGKGTRFIKELTESQEFGKATNCSLKDERMTAQECVLRYVSFLLLGKESYEDNDNADSFLGKTLTVLNYLDELDSLKISKLKNNNKNLTIKYNSYEKIKSLFILGLTRNFELFGRNAFRLMSLKAQKRTPINKSLLETFGTLFSQISDSDFEILISRKTEFFDKYESIRNTDEFYRAVSRDPWKKNNVEYRFNILTNLIKEIIL